MSKFPRTTVGGVSLPRMLIGTNWILGYSHTSSAADGYINKINRNSDAISDIICTFLEYDIDAIMAPISSNPVLVEGIKKAEAATGKKVIMIDTPIINVNDNEEGRKEAQSVIDLSAKIGCTFCMPHHSSVEQIVNKNKHEIQRLPDYLYMIREKGMNTGLSAHMPEIIIFSDEQNYDVDTYIQLYNCMGFLMQIEVEYIHKVIWGAKKPVMTIKPMAAGRVSPFVGITFSFATLRECDMVTVGCMTPEEAFEDIEIGLAAIERRMPNLAGRSSPNKTVIMKD